MAFTSVFKRLGPKVADDRTPASEMRAAERRRRRIERKVRYDGLKERVEHLEKINVELKSTTNGLRFELEIKNAEVRALHSQLEVDGDDDKLLRQLVRAVRSRQQKHRLWFTYGRSEGCPDSKKLWQDLVDFLDSPGTDIIGHLEPRKNRGRGRPV